jgi:hypothetical protein
MTRGRFSVVVTPVRAPVERGQTLKLLDTATDPGFAQNDFSRQNGSWPYIRDTWKSDRPSAPPAPAPTP